MENSFGQLQRGFGAWNGPADSVLLSRQSETLLGRVLCTSLPAGLPDSQSFQVVPRSCLEVSDNALTENDFQLLKFGSALFIVDFFNAGLAKLADSSGQRDAALHWVPSTVGSAKEGTQHPTLPSPDECLEAFRGRELVSYLCAFTGSLSAGSFGRYLDTKF